MKESSSKMKRQWMRTAGRPVKESTERLLSRSFTFTSEQLNYIDGKGNGSQYLRGLVQREMDNEAVSPEHAKLADLVERLQAVEAKYQKLWKQQLHMLDVNENIELRRHFRCQESEDEEDKMELVEDDNGNPLPKDAQGIVLLKLRDEVMREMDEVERQRKQLEDEIKRLYGDKADTELE
jgi:hypothetical protein